MDAEEHKRPALLPVNVTLGREQVAAFDELAEANLTNRSVEIRQALNDFLRRNAGKPADRKRGYAR